MTNAMPLGTNEALTRGLYSEYNSVAPVCQSTVPSLARPGCAVPFQPLGHTAAAMNGYTMNNSFGHAAMHVHVTAPVAPPINDLTAPAHNHPYRVQMPRSSRPKLVPDKRVYRGGIISSDDAERAYVHTFSSVSHISLHHY